MIYGKHVKLQAYGIDPITLKSKQQAERFLADALTITGRLIYDLVAYDIEDAVCGDARQPSELERGAIVVTGITNLSYGAMRTFPDDGYLIADIYCCRYFEAGPIESILLEVYNPVRVGVDDLSYSHVFPDKKAARVNN